MDELTLIAGISFSVLVIFLRPGYALAAYITALLWYPNYMMISIGTIDISIGRIVVTVLLLRCLFDSKISKSFKWTSVDTWIVIAMITFTAPLFIYLPFKQAFENRSGFLMDSLLAYMVTRLIITDYQRLIQVLKWLAFALVPLAAVGVFEAVTEWPPYEIIFRHSRYFQYVSYYGTRWGFKRAVGPFSHTILFGCTFAIFFPLLYYLRNEQGKWRRRGLTFALAMVAGTMSSLSSGAWVAMIVAVFCVIMEKYKRWVKPMLICFAIGCILIAFISNRPFYHVIASYANPFGGGGWHRAKLIDLAIENFPQWWFLGYRGEDPGWGPTLGMEITDITNEFILAGVRYGIWGIIALCGLLWSVFHGIYKSYHRTRNPRLRSFYWAAGSVLISITVTWISVSFFGQLIPLFYFIVGITAASFGFIPVRKQIANAKVNPAIERQKRSIPGETVTTAFVNINEN